ncbi:MAG TPA: TetR/AcrR family transcriptional regulator [Streptosporangiaceae bacterium]|jgi:AcrR family transcriptional regulator|nr:TetR/AcrR family transcriptional regulator [Streptosporangiaceae bacterium]
MAGRTDPRITRTVRALAQAITELAAQRPVSQITVADLADRAGVTRATFYNRYGSPLELLIQVLYADLERGHRREEERRADARYSAEQMLRLSTGDVADHVERFMAVYQHALGDPADDGVYEALVRHFTDYGLAFIARCTHPDLPRANHEVIAQFVAHGFAGAIKAWLSHDSVTKSDLVDAAVACAPAWWS